MEKEIIILLMEKGYSERNAKIVAHELMQLAEPLKPLLQSWLSNENNTPNYEVHDYSIYGLMQQRRMNYPAALLTIDWLIKEPTKAKQSLTRGIK